MFMYNYSMSVHGAMLYVGPWSVWYPDGGHDDNSVVTA